jgi:hypothetical protein
MRRESGPIGETGRLTISRAASVNFMCIALSATTAGSVNIGAVGMIGVTDLGEVEIGLSS